MATWCSEESDGTQKATNMDSSQRKLSDQQSYEESLHSVQYLGQIAAYARASVLIQDTDVITASPKIDVDV